MRYRSFEIDPFVVVIAAVVAIAAFVAGAGAWAIVAGGVTIAAGLGTRPIGAAISRRFTMPPPGSPERALVIRSREAVASMVRVSRSVPDGPIALRCQEMERAARAALPTILALAIQAAAVSRLAAGVNVPQLESERANTNHQLAGSADDRLRFELESSLRSTESQLATARRLASLAGELGARTRALTTSIEAVAAGLTELMAMSAGNPDAQPYPTLATLSREIEALRGGLAEAQSFGRLTAGIHQLED